MAMSSSRIRVAYCIDNMQVGGTELNAVRTAEILDRERFELRVICLQEHGPLLERYAAAGIPVHTLPLGSLYRPTALRRGRELMALLRRHGVEVLHAHDVYSNLFGVGFARLAGVRAIASRRWWGGSPGLHWRLASASAYRLADAVLANSPGVAELVVRQERIARRKVHVVPNFLDDAMFDAPPPADCRARRTALGIPDDRPVVGVVANLNPVKNQAMLLGAVARLVRDGTPVYAALVGDGPERPALEALAARLGIAAHVGFAGRLPNRPNLHHLFDVSVLCSHSEGLPNSVLEAMAARRPVVATRVGAVADVVRDGETGLLVEPGDEAALARALARLLAEPAEAARMGRAALEYARARHTPRVALDALETLYQTVARRPAPAPRRRDAAPALTQTIS
jgi:L-malate glycosyltransferase